MTLAGKQFAKFHIENVTGTVSYSMNVIVFICEFTKPLRCHAALHAAPACEVGLYGAVPWSVFCASLPCCRAFASLRCLYAYLSCDRAFQNFHSACMVKSGQRTGKMQCWHPCRGCSFSILSQIKWLVLLTQNRTFQG